MSRRVVISSLTGKPMPWGEDEDENPGTGTAQDADQPAAVPRRAAEDDPSRGEDESNDARLRQDVPPHWGRGQ